MASGEFVRAARATFFSGRDAFLQTLRETLLHSQVAAIAGPDGVGKTAVAREYVYRFSQEYQQVFWLNATTGGTFMADMLEIAQRLSLPIDITQGFTRAFQTLQGWLAKQTNFLLVLDGPAFRQMARSLPRGQQMSGHVLLIAHAPDPPSAITRLDVDILDEREGALLVLRRAGLLPPDVRLEQAEEEQRIVAQELARELRGSPITLNLAGGYLNATSDSIGNYLQAYRSSLKEDEQDAQAVAYDLLLTHLEQTRPAALELLLACAFLSPDAIPARLFTQSAYAQQEQNAMEGAIQLLAACGLLGVERSMVYIHPLLQATVRQSLTPGEQQQQVERLLSAFHQLLLSFEKESLAARVRVAGHIQQLAVLSEEWTLSFDEAAETFGWAGSLLWEQGLTRDAETLLRSALVTWERTRGIAQERIATMLFNLATLNCLLKNYRAAEAFSQRAILTVARALGANHHDVLLYLDNLGHIYAEQSKQQEARLCYEKAIAIGDRAGLQEHPHYISSAYDLAMSYIEDGLFYEAEPLLQIVCAAWDLPRDTRDPAIVGVWLRLAEVSVKLRYWRQAEECYQRVLQVYEQQTAREQEEAANVPVQASPQPGRLKAGEEHPEILHIMEQLARVYFQQEKLAEAEAYLQRVLRARAPVLGVDHPDVAVCLNGLAMVRMGRGQFDEALALIERAQSIYEKREPEGLALADVLDNLVIIANVQERYEQAISIAQRSLDIRMRILGDDHMGLVENLSSLATLHLMVEQPNQAEPLLLHALTIYQNAEAPEDLVLDLVLTDLATITMERAQYWQAKMYLEQSCAIRTRVLGDGSPDLAEVLDRLASIAIAEEEWEEAETLYQQALSIYQSMPGGEQQALECLEQIAAVLVRLEKYEDAQVALQRILSVREQELGKGHLDLVGILLALGQVSLFQDRFEETEAYLQRTMAIYEQNPGVQPLGAVILFSSLATALEDRGEPERAASLAQKASVLTEQVLRSSNPST